MTTDLLIGLAPITVSQLVCVWAALTLPWLAFLVARPVLWARRREGMYQDVTAPWRRPMGLLGAQILLLLVAVLAHRLNPQHTLPMWLIPALGLTQIGFLTMGACAGWQGAPVQGALIRKR